MYNIRNYLAQLFTKYRIVIYLYTLVEKRGTARLQVDYESVDFFFMEHCAVRGPIFKRMKDYFFEDIFSALLYIVFNVAFPIVAIFLQFFSNDSTMYLSYFVTGFSMTFDYLSLFKQKTSKRLWVEALVSSCCFATVLIVGFTKMSLVFSSLSSQQGVLKYGFGDFLAVSVLAVMVVINVYEFGGLVKHETNLRYPKSTGSGQALVEGAKNI